MIDWNKLKSEFEQEDISLKALAEKYGLSPSTVRSRKNRERWQRNATENGATRRNATDRRGGQRQNKNAVGNQGGPPPRNQNAMKHGLHSKYLPADVLEITQELADSSPVDMLWDSITIQWAAILRAQQIMYVTGKDEMIKEVKKEKASGGKESRSQETEWNFQFSWERYADFMNAQSRAMTTLSGLIKQFVTIADEADERRQKLTLIEAQIVKTRAEAEIIDNQAQKLQRGGKVNSLLQALLDVKKGGDGSGQADV